MEVVLWAAFGVVVLGMLALDLGVFHRTSHEVRFREALTLSAVWIGLALLFNVGVWLALGSQAGLEFLTAYLIEKSLSVDNVFVFALVFGYFAVPARYQHRVLFWGIVGALAFRAVFIAGGIALLEAFHWTVYVFGAILLVTAIRLFFEKDKEIHPERNPVLRLFRRFVPVTEHYEGERFWVRRDGRWWATPLFVALLLIELTDLLFAVDSVPAVLAVSRDPFIVYTSNVFAILGLRALYFALAGVLRLFHHLHYGLALILAFVAAKLLLSGVVKVPTALSLCVIAVILAGSVAVSLRWPRREAANDLPAPPPGSPDAETAPAGTAAKPTA
jgi:tellurite resistance protein TerC